jgi:hypothetical protein
VQDSDAYERPVSKARVIGLEAEYAAMAARGAVLAPGSGDDAVFHVSIVEGRQKAHELGIFAIPDTRIKEVVIFAHALPDLS